MRKSALLLLAGCLCLGACQPAPEEVPPPHEAAVLDYSLLGIWPERFLAYEVSTALGEAGIRSKLSGSQPCLLNVETSKMGQAQAIVAANPKWQQSRIR